MNYDRFNVFDGFNDVVNKKIRLAWFWLGNANFIFELYYRIKP